MGETKKVQLAVRVPADVRDLCLELARKVGVSKNVFVEKLIRAAAQAPNMHAPLEIPVVSDSAVDVGTVEIRDGEQTVGRIVNVGDIVRDDDGLTVVVRRPFAPNCRAGTLHWKHGPGNPCKFCDGEI